MPSDDHKFVSFSASERKDRLHDSHGVYCYKSKLIYVINADVESGDITPIDITATIDGTM